MLRETGFRLELRTPYHDYLDNGGHLAFPEYEFVTETLEYGIYCPECPRRRGQILDIASRCGLELTETEIAIYTKLRERTEVFPIPEEVFDERARSACCMGDTELVAEIFLLTDKTGKNYQAVVNTYPHIFGND
jgi:hypothetical protein